jgi:hypothetical protein
MEKLTTTVAAITHILGCEPTRVTDNSVSWHPESGIDAENPMVIIENENEPLFRIDENEPVSVKCNFEQLEQQRDSKVPGYAVVGYCQINRLGCRAIETVGTAEATPIGGMDLDAIQADLENALAVLRRLKE